MPFFLYPKKKTITKFLETIILPSENQEKSQEIKGFLLTTVSSSFKPKTYMLFYGYAAYS